MTFKPLYLAALPLLVFACAHDDAQFTVDVSTAELSGQATVAVFGVYRDGRMDPSYWNMLAPYVNNVLASPHCEVLYGDHLQNEDDAGFIHIDTDSRENGVTSELVNHFAARAASDVIVVFNVSGKPPVAKGPSGSSGPALTGTGLSGGIGGRHGGRGGRQTQRQQPSNQEQSVFEVSASLFSVTTHAFVGRLYMSYSGNNAEDGLAKFADKLHSLMPKATCVGWKWHD